MAKVRQVFLLVCVIFVFNHRVLAQWPRDCRPVKPDPPIPINRLCDTPYEYYGGLATTLDGFRENLCCVHRRYIRPSYRVYNEVEEGYNEGYY